MHALDEIHSLSDEDTIHKTTICEVDSLTQITIEVAIDDAAASGNYVKAYHPDAAVPVTLSHVGNDTYQDGEISGSYKAAIYIDGQQTLGTGGTSLRDIKIEQNPGFGLFVRDYNTASIPLRLENICVETNASTATT